MSPPVCSVSLGGLRLSGSGSCRSFVRQCGLSRGLAGSINLRAGCTPVATFGVSERGAGYEPRSPPHYAAGWLSGLCLLEVRAEDGSVVCAVPWSAKRKSLIRVGMFEKMKVLDVHSFERLIGRCSRGPDSQPGPSFLGGTDAIITRRYAPVRFDPMVCP